MEDKSERDKAVAALHQTCAMLDDLNLQYVVYIRTAPGIYARRIKFKSATEMIQNVWSVSIDLSETVYDIAEIACNEVDDKLGGP
jgi:hypothetical protein